MAITLRRLFNNSFFVDPKTKASVISLDYSNCGNYLSSVYENGTVNIYGLTTGIRSDTVSKLDKHSSVARFHPGKRYLLGVASYSGTVSVYDISYKRIHFQAKEAHLAPCSDLAMSEDSPNFLYTCGADSCIKIFDLRKKSTGLQVSTHCGLSSIGVSKSGEYIAVGNLKGELLTYDIRVLKQPLAKKRIDNELITRVAFIPTWGSSTDQLATMYESATASLDELPEVADSNDNFTMEDIVGFQKGRISEIDLSYVSRVSTFSTQGDNEGRRISDNFAQNIGNALNDLSFSSDVSFAENSPVEIDDRNVNTDRMKRFSGGKKDSISKRRSSYMPSPLQLIHEEAGDKENSASFLNKLLSPMLSLSANGGPRGSSTPMTVVKVTKKPPTEEAETSNEVIDVDALDASTNEDSEQQVAATIVQPPQAIAHISFDLKQEFESLREKIHLEVQSLNMDMTMRHIEVMSQVSTQRFKLQNRIQTIEECLGILMNEDVKINRIMDLQAENLELRRQLDNMARSFNQ